MLEALNVGIGQFCDAAPLDRDVGTRCVLDTEVHVAVSALRSRSHALIEVIVLVDVRH